MPFKYKLRNLFVADIKDMNIDILTATEDEHFIKSYQASSYLTICLFCYRRSFILSSAIIFPRLSISRTLNSNCIISAIDSNGISFLSYDTSTQFDNNLICFI